MGEYAERAIEQEMDFDCRVPIRRAKKDLSTWKSRDGQVIKLTDMLESRIVNTIAMLRRKNQAAFSDRIAALEAELSARQSNCGIQAEVAAQPRHRMKA